MFWCFLPSKRQRSFGPFNMVGFVEMDHIFLLWLQLWVWPASSWDSIGSFVGEIYHCDTLHSFWGLDHLATVLVPCSGATTSQELKITGAIVYPALNRLRWLKHMDGGLMDRKSPVQARCFTRQIDRVIYNSHDAMS